MKFSRNDILLDLKPPGFDQIDHSLWGDGDLVKIDLERRQDDTSWKLHFSLSIAIFGLIVAIVDLIHILSR